MNGFFKPKAKPLAKFNPTNKQVIKPGENVALT